MQRSEVRDMLRGFYDAYPTSRAVSEAQIEIWDRHLSATPINTARTAYNRWVAEQRKPPTVAEFLEACKAIGKGRARALPVRPHEEPLSERQRLRAGAMAKMLRQGLKTGQLPSYAEMVAELGPYEDPVPRFRCPRCNDVGMICTDDEGGAGHGYFRPCESCRPEQHAYWLENVRR